MSTNLTPFNDQERAREITEARAELLRRTEVQGVRPLKFDELLGDSDTGQTEEEIRREVDDFLTLLREVRGGPTGSPRI